MEAQIETMAINIANMTTSIKTLTDTLARPHWVDYITVGNMIATTLGVALASFWNWRSDRKSIEENVNPLKRELRLALAAQAKAESRAGRAWGDNAGFRDRIKALERNMELLLRERET
ncbi:MAG: hypothetical protein M1817_004703 [Caeruleum heppii]|nr:MAG: hypothetical protein M1817_004703 [Caeruleum heppii]